jgi:hypothetical protein
MVDVRKRVETIVKLGPLPGQDVGEDVIRRHQDALESVPTPVTDAEAAQLATAFGRDDCFGLAWMLLHKIETAPTWVPHEADGVSNEWISRLRRRAQCR